MMKPPLVNNSYNSFRESKIKLRTKKNFKITNSYGNKHAWRWLRKNKWLNLGQPVTEREFGLIVKGINEELVNRLMKGHDIIFPYKMGKIWLCKYPTFIKCVDGKIITNLAPDWKRTLQYWHEDKEAMEKKIIIRKSVPEIYKLLYTKSRANFTNMKYYQFSFCRSLKRRLSGEIKNNNIDAFLVQ